MDVYQNGELKFTYNWTNEIILNDLQKLIRDNGMELSNDIEVTETFGVIGDIYEVNEKIYKYINISNIKKHNINILNDNMFKLHLKGNLLTIISIIELSDIKSIAPTLYKCLSVEFNLLNYVLYGINTPHHLHQSLIINYIKEKNFYMDNGNVLDELRRFNMDRLKSYLNTIVMKIYGVPISKLECDNKNKLSLNNLDDFVLDKINSYISTRSD